MLNIFSKFCKKRVSAGHRFDCTRTIGTTVLCFSLGREKVLGFVKLFRNSDKSHNLT